MRYFRIAFGMLKMALISFFSCNNIKFKYPIRLGRNATISRRRHGRIELGKHVSLNSNAQLAVTQNATIIIGDYSGVGDNSIIVAHEKITIGNNVMIGPNVCIYDHDHVFRKEGIMRNMGFKSAPVSIEDNVWIGAGAIILRGVTIGTGSVIAAGSIVTKDIPKNSIVYNKIELVIKSK